MNKLSVVVNHELTLDAGRWEESPEGRMVYPPERTMFHQILDYLERHPPANKFFVTSKYQALIAANVCLRWGSYFAVLADPHKPVSPQLRGQGYDRVSHLADGEMARINIEASAALAQWIDLYRQDEDRHTTLACRAFEALPFSRRSLSGYPDLPAFWAAHATRLELSAYERQFPDTVRGVKAHPTRVFANALINYSWRNGSGVEAIHGGQVGNYSLLTRRIRPSDERSIFYETAFRLREGFLTLQKLTEAGDHNWTEQVMPFAFSAHLLVTPSGWSLTDETTWFELPPMSAV